MVQRRSVKAGEMALSTGLIALVAGIVLLLMAVVFANARWLRSRPVNAPDVDPVVSTTVDPAGQTGADSGRARPVGGTEQELAVAGPDLWIVDPGTRLESGSGKVFDRTRLPFRLADTVVPQFAEERWKRLFYRLTEDRRVLGWIAFRAGAAGASDRDYEPSFLDVLQAYWTVVDKVRDEVGLSTVRETSIVGREGKGWFLAADDGVSLALFVDLDVDIRELADRYLEPVREQSAPTA